MSLRRYLKIDFLLDQLRSKAILLSKIKQTNLRRICLEIIIKIIIQLKKVLNSFIIQQVLMEPGAANKHIVKIEFKKQIRKLSFNNFNLQDFISKVRKYFRMAPKTYYSFTYQFNNTDLIAITSQSEFQNFLEANKKNEMKLKIEESNNPDLDLTNCGQRIQNYKLKNQQLTIRVNQLRQEIKNHLEQFKKELVSKMGQKIDLLNKVHHMSDDVVHYGVKCIKCKINDIRGARYICLFCNCDLCQKCEENDEEHTKHRIVKVKDKKQLQFLNKRGLMNQTIKKVNQHEKKNGNQRERENEKEKLEEKGMKGDKITILMQNLNLQETAAQEFLSKYPNNSIEQLVDFYFASMIPKLN